MRLVLFNLEKLQALRASISSSQAIRICCVVPSREAAGEQTDGNALSVADIVVESLRRSPPKTRFLDERDEVAGKNVEAPRES